MQKKQKFKVGQKVYVISGDEINESIIQTVRTVVNENIYGETSERSEYIVSEKGEDFGLETEESFIFSNRKKAEDVLRKIWKSRLKTTVSDTILVLRNLQVELKKIDGRKYRKIIGFIDNCETVIKTMVKIK